MSILARGLWLSSSGLLSKWGFGDGDPFFDDYIDWCDDHGHPYPADEAELLRTLVRDYLVPVLDQDVELVAIETSHNPIRAEKVDGVDVRDLWNQPVAPAPALTPDGVLVPYAEVLRVAQAVGLRELPSSRPMTL